MKLTSGHLLNRARAHRADTVWWAIAVVELAAAVISAFNRDWWAAATCAGMVLLCAGIASNDAREAG